MKSLNSPHILLASSNPVKMLRNLNHLLEVHEVAKLQAEINRNVSQLFALGEAHFIFAQGIPDEHWRQKISRLYYAAYNARRAVSLKYDGSFSTDSSDHKNVENLPPEITDKEKFSGNLRTLREDRNLADYSHEARRDDLVMQPDDALVFVGDFLEACKTFIESGN